MLGCLLLAPSAFAAEEPLRVLLLDYHDPTEHDVLLSHLCVERCSRATGCPDAYIRDGVDYWSDDFRVYRPSYLGRTVNFVVDAYKSKAIDFVSFSGHHASGFSGERGRGRFDTEKLNQDLVDKSGGARFFTHPSLVLLHGCRTDVKSRFDGDPVAYVLHVIEDTQVREDQFDRLLAAVQQIGGVQEAYRELFPNACILGYRGTQTPGGRLEIYGQVASFLRALAYPDVGERPPPRIDLTGAYRSQQTAAGIARRIENECPRGWPCNLCAVAPETYRPQADALADLLVRERRRIHQDRRLPAPGEVVRREQLLEGASFYANTRWSCAVKPPGTPPVWPDPVDESPFGRLFVELLFLDYENFQPAQRQQLRAELLHRLGGITFAEIDKIELRAWLHADQHWLQLESFLERTLLGFSTFRQRDFFRFLAAVECGDCFELVLNDETPPLLRENAASQLHPVLGRAPFALALADGDSRVRRLAAARLEAGLGLDLLRRALADDDPEVRALVTGRFNIELETTPPALPLVY